MRKIRLCGKSHSHMRTNSSERETEQDTTLRLAESRLRIKIKNAWCISRPKYFLIFNPHFDVIYKLRLKVIIYNTTFQEKWKLIF
jgi:hypothetical protein